MVDDFQALLVDRAQYYATATRGELIADVSVSADAAPVKLRLPVFTYTTKLRASVAGMLSSSHSDDPIWLRELSGQPAKALSDELDSAANGSFSDLVVEGSEPDAQRWILENQYVLSALKSGPDSEPVAEQ